MAKDSSAITKQDRQRWAGRPRRKKDSDRKDRISFRVHTDLRDVLEAAAERDLRTMSAFVEILLINTLRDTFGAPLDGKGRITEPGWAMPTSGGPLSTPVATPTPDPPPAPTPQPGGSMIVVKMKRRRPVSK